MIQDAQIIKLTEERDEALALLKQANDLIEGDTKAQLVKDASEVSEISLPELAGKDIFELETIIAVSKMTRKPKSKFESGADLGVTGTNDFDSRTHLHGLYLGNKGK